MHQIFIVSSTQVIIIPLLGIPRRAEVGFCKCRSDTLTLVELGYWPATPSRPKVAFSFAFLDWMEALLLECQVVVQDYCNAVEFLLKNRLNEVCTLYVYMHVYNYLIWCVFTVNVFFLISDAM